MKNIYREQGYKDRQDYLEILADDMCLPLEVVLANANRLGPDADFDELIVCLENIQDAAIEAFLG